MGEMKHDERPTGEIDYITLREAAMRCKVKPETVRIWIIRGVRIRNRREPVRLKAHWIGGRWVTTHDWVSDYIDASTKSRIGCWPESWREERDAAAKVLGRKSKQPA